MIAADKTVFDLEQGVPTVRATAQSLARLPRWCGATRFPWSVAQHSLVMAEFMAALGPWPRLAALTHDWAEGFGLGDIASPLKTDDIRLVEVQLRYRVVKDQLCLWPQEMHELEVWWNDCTLHDADHWCRKVERFLMIDQQSSLDGIPPLYVQRLQDLTFKYGYRETPWREAELVQHLVNAVDDATAAVFAVWPTPPRPVRPSVAGPAKPVLVDPRLPISVSGGTPATRPDVGGVASDVAAATVKVCSVCCAEYGDDVQHACHPDANGPAD